MKKNFNYLALLILAVSFYSCYKKPVEEPPIVQLPKSVVLKLLETDSGVNLNWSKVNISKEEVSYFEIWRSRAGQSGIIFSPWAGNFSWTSSDSTFFDNNPEFSKYTNYQVIAVLKGGERVFSNTLQVDLKNSIFIDNYNTIRAFNDISNNTVYIADAYSKKIQAIDYQNDKSFGETDIETEMGNGGGLFVADKEKELYVSSSSYGKINIFDSKTLKLKKTMNKLSYSFAERKDFIYSMGFSNQIDVIQKSDNTITQSFNFWPTYGEMRLLAVPNANKIIGVVKGNYNRLKEFTIDDTNGKIILMNDVLLSNSNDSIFGLSYDIHPSNSTLIGGFKGSIYSTSDFSYKKTINYQNKPFGFPIYSFSTNGKFLAVTLEGFGSPIIDIYEVDTYKKKESFELPNCVIQNLSWNNNTLIMVANPLSSSYFGGTVIVKRKI